ncbi:MAG: hypothetical protein HKP40_08320 [Litoreibacter sp.]|nr:hypothetical protein [Litoreibacter sp.]
MRNLSFGVALVVLAGCAQPVPDSGVQQGVGFGSYDQYIAEQQARDEALQTLNEETVRPPEDIEIASAELTGAAAVAALENTSTEAVVPAPDLNNPDISDEQDFEAVSTRQTIESDAERLKAQRQQYQLIEPTAVPRRPRGKVPTPIEFALLTQHPVGQKQYRRSLFGASKAEAKCAGYRSGEQAQDAFLKAGGPERDKLGLDPDGDGYACDWNPGVYRGLGGN